MADMPAEIDELFDDSMPRRLFETVRRGDTTYYVVDIVDEDSGEMKIVRVEKGGAPEFVDTIPPDPMAGGGLDDLSPALRERFDTDREERDDMGGGGPPAGGTLLDQWTINVQFHNKAVRYTGLIDPDEKLSSANAPGTSGGNLACAWAVNRVAKDSLGRKIGGGLATAEMIKVLKLKHKEVDSEEMGCVVISPSQNVTKNGVTKWVTGHVGIVGILDENDPEKTPIYSNSSGAAEWQKNFWISKWRNKYTGMGLKMRFFLLAPGEFPEAANIA